MNSNLKLYHLDSCSSNTQEQVDPAVEQKLIQQLEKEIQELRDHTEDLTFKAQRHEEEAASLCSQNALLVRKCSDLQRQLIECLSTVDVLDIRCNDAESKLKRVRLALEDKEYALLTMSGEHSAALIKIEENERELERVQAEMDNVSRKFVRVSCNQRELKEDLLFYKNILKKRDQKIQKLLEDRLRMSSRIEELRAQKAVRVPCSCNKNRNIDKVIATPAEGDQCAELIKNITAGDKLLTERMLTLKSDNARLTSQNVFLNDELGNRCAIGILRMNNILEKMESVEDDMIRFLSMVEKKAEHVNSKPRSNVQEDESERIFRDSDLMQELARLKEEVRAVRLANCYLQELIKAQASCLGTMLPGQKVADVRQEQVDVEESFHKEICGKITESMDVRGLQGLTKMTDEHGMLADLGPLSVSQPILLKNLKGKGVMSLDHILKNTNQSGEQQFLETSQDFFHMVDLLCVSQICTNVYEELFRLSVLLQLCLLKMKTIIPEENQYYLPVVSGLKGVLLKVRSTISSYESRSSKGSQEEENFYDVTLPVWMYYGSPEDEPKPVSSAAQSRACQKCLCREIVATTETERHVGKKRHRIQHFHKSHVKLMDRASTWPSNPVKDDNKIIQKFYTRGQHQVCTDLVVNLQRNLLASGRTKIQLQEKLLAKIKETQRLQQEVANLRLSLEAVNDVLDNKKIALGRSEAIWQMLRVSEASLEQRLEVEQRQHEDCRQQLEKLATVLEEMRMKYEDRKDHLASNGGDASTTFTFPPPAPMMNRKKLNELLTHSKPGNKDLTRLMDDCVSLMIKDMNLLRDHFEEKRNNASPDSV